MLQLIQAHRYDLAEHERTYFHRVFQLQRRIPQFYMIPKVHKTPWATRPIVSCVNSTLGYLSKYVDRQLQKVVHLCPAYLQDSNTLLLRLHALGQLPSTARLITADAVSMYTNIDTNHGLQNLRLWFDLHADHLPTDFPVDFVINATKLIMTANVFQFDDTYWLQLCGTAMGTSLACMYATIYYSYHEETSIVPLLSQQQKPPQPANPIILYARLIDDVFQIWDLAKLPPPITIANLTPSIASAMHFGSLSWDVEPPKRTVNFLDLTITLMDDGKISTTTFIKPMNLHLYIPPHSAHSKGVLKSLVFGTVQRYWSQNSDRNTFVSTTRSFYEHLLNRAYKPSELDPLFEEVTSLIDSQGQAVGKPRLPTSSQHPNQQTSSGRQLFLHWEYHPRDISRRSIQEAYQATLEPIITKPPLYISQFTIAYHNPKSLRNCLTKTQLQEPLGAQATNHIELLEPQSPANP
jgi:hypothetical protein